MQEHRTERLPGAQLREGVVGRRADHREQRTVGLAGGLLNDVSGGEAPRVREVARLLAGKQGKVEKVDDTTVAFKFDAPLATDPSAERTLENATRVITELSRIKTNDSVVCVKVLMSSVSR